MLLPNWISQDLLRVCYVGEPDAWKHARPVRRGLGGNVHPQGCNAPPFHSMLIARPRPVPPNLRVVDESAWEKDWNRRGM